jgi:hypothetical protein
MQRRFEGSRSARITSPSGEVIEAILAERFTARLLGLAWLPSRSAPALLIPGCRSVHTFGMRFAIDVVFLALPVTGGRKQGGGSNAPVLDVRAAVPPRRLASARRSGPTGTRIATLELPAGAAEGAGIEPSLELEWALLDCSGQTS